MRIGQTTAIVFIAKIVTSILGFVATIYFARILGAEVLGYYAAILAVASWFKLPANIGVSRSVTKRVSEGEEQSQYFTAGLLLVLALGGIASVIAWIFREPLDAYIGVEATLFVIVIVLTYLYLSIVKSTLSGEKLVHISEILNTTKVGLRSVLQIALVFFTSLGLVGLIIGYITAAFVTATIGIVLISSSFARPEKRHFRSLYDFAKYAWLGNMRSRSFNNIDILILTAMVNPTLVGVYSVAWGITNLFKTFGAAIRGTIFPEISSANEDANESLISQLLSDAITYSGLLVIPGFFGGIIVGERLLTLYGETFRQGAIVLSLLLFTALLYEYYKQILNALNAIDRPDISFQINAIFIIENAILNVILIYIVGWIGAAIATVISAATGVTLAYVAIKKQVHFEIPTGELGRQVLSGLIMTGIVLILQYVLTTVLRVTHNLFILLILVATGSFVYFVTLLYLSQQFRTILVTNIPDRAFVFNK